MKIWTIDSEEQANSVFDTLFESAIKEVENVEVLNTEPERSYERTGTPDPVLTPEEQQRNKFSEFISQFVFEDLTDGQIKKAQKLLYDNRDVFSKHDFDIGECKEFVQPMNTKSGFTAKNHKPYNYSAKDRQIIDEWAQEMKKAGLVTESTSCMASPIVLVKRPGKAPRPTINLIWLNKHLIQEQYPSMSIKDCVNALKGAVYKSTIDLTKAFYNIVIDPKDRWKTAFRTHRELLEFVRLPQGAANAPKACQHLTDIICGMYKLIFLTNYLDDLLCYSKTFDEHLDHLNILFASLRKYNVKINPKKCQFFRKKVKYLGYDITEEGISIDRERIKAILDIPIPRNIKELRRFMGIVSFCREYIDRISFYAKPMYDLIKSGKNERATFTSSEWTQKQQKSFEYYKKALTSPPCLTHPDEKLKKVIQTDACNYAVGGFIGQVENGKVKPIAYFNRTLSKSQINWSTVEKEMYGIITACRNYSALLSDEPFDIYTDHKPLLVLNKLKSTTNINLIDGQ